MKTLWCVGLVLLLAVEAGAVELYSGGMCRDGGLWFPARADGMCHTADIPRAMEACYQRMEAAMRAMEPYLPSALIQADMVGKVYSSRQYFDLRQFNAYAESDQLWYAAKKACWRTP